MKVHEYKGYSTLKTVFKSVVHFISEMVYSKINKVKVF